MKHAIGLKHLIKFSWLLLLGLVACSDGGGEDSPEESSSSMASSSSLSDREEIVYADTLLLDSLVLLSLPDTSTSGSWTLFIPHPAGYAKAYPAGSKWTVWAATQNLGNAKLRLRREGSVKYLQPTDPLSDGKYADYMEPGSDTTLWVGNDFLSPDSGFFLLELEGEPTTDTVLLRIHVIPYSGYFDFYGQADSLGLNVNDTLRGFFMLNQTQRQMKARFRSPAGYNINMVTSGSMIDSTWLADSASGSVIQRGGSSLRQQLLPQAASAWDLSVRTVEPTFLDGPYAIFNMELTGLQLQQGEYLLNPDSIVKWGDTLKVLRPRNEQARYDVRHDQYVWLGNLAAGDSLIVVHNNEGFTSLIRHMRILDASGKMVDTLVALRNFGFKAKTAGAHYLHYYRTNSWVEDLSYSLTLTTVVQKPGSLTGWSLQPSAKSINLGDTDPSNDTVWVKTIEWIPAPVGGSTSAQWFIPCAEVQAGVISDGRTTTTCVGEESPLAQPWVVGKKAGTATIISRSVADPTKFAELLITVE